MARRPLSDLTTRVLATVASFVHPLVPQAPEPRPAPDLGQLSASAPSVPAREQQGLVVGTEYHAPSAEPGHDHEHLREQDRPEEEQARARAERRGHGEAEVGSTRLPGAPTPPLRKGQTDTTAEPRRRPEARRRRR
jgi:hypothetical protein